MVGKPFRADGWVTRLDAHFQLAVNLLRREKLEVKPSPSATAHATTVNTVC